MIVTGDQAVSISCDALGVSPTEHSVAIVYGDSKPRCGVLWEGYTGTHIEAKLWGTSRFVPHTWLGLCLHYAFIYLGVSAIVVACSAQDHATERAVVRLGGVLEGVVAEGMPDGSAMTIFTIRKEDCRQLNKLVRKVPNESRRL